MVRWANRLLRQWVLGLERADDVPREKEGKYEASGPFLVVDPGMDSHLPGAHRTAPPGR